MYRRNVCRCLEIPADKRNEPNCGCVCSRRSGRRCDWRRDIRRNGLHGAATDQRFLTRAFGAVWRRVDCAVVAVAVRLDDAFEENVFGKTGDAAGA
uniref:Uncharacterized protein n=1 Tax=Romanomermis culicivorax TaxID=13658 RepID=A0A915I7Z6_ROMCU